MSTGNTNDIENIPSNQENHGPQSDNDVITHHSQPNLIQIKTEGIQPHSSSPAIVSSLNVNNDIIPAAVVYDSTNNPPVFGKDIFQIREYTAWSMFNITFCCFFLGICALHMSCVTKRKKRLGNFIRAQDTSQLAVLLNIITSLTGFLMYLLFTLRYIGGILP